ncbi:hypothetical protein [Anabaena lutea]|uniref:Uncharacterized protein n=1 Tax=Anabaena lutea FACHB-196 TaxID=2692881 RepID=A0ABR8FKW7_9NOST|nr:hypothetical protein [Anabaena lutea]MBD2570233.1 hypothetical protein [Anabaena lutea FACHB-196]
MTNLNNPNNRENHLRNEQSRSYDHGYSDGRVSGTNLKNEALEARDQNNTASGFIIGMGITALLTMGGLAYYFWGRPTTNSVIVTPAPAPAQQPAKQTTIIEKTNTVERVPVPADVPTPAQQRAPNVNVKVDVPQPQVPKQEKTDVKVIAPNNPQPAPAQQNTTINVAPAESSTKTPTSTSTPDKSSSNTQTYPNTPKANSDAGTTTNSNP